MKEKIKQKISIQPITFEALLSVSKIHHRAFPDSALTKLGIEAVRRYYHWQLNGPHDCCAIAAYDCDQMLGFCFGGVFRGSLGGFLRNNQSFLIRRVLFHPCLLSNELFRNRIKSALRSLSIAPPVKVQPSATLNQKNQSYGILSIAVDPEVQAYGVGHMLMQAAEQDAISKGFIQMHLTVSPKNMQAISFYLGLGWVKKGDPWAGSMIKELTV